MSDPFLGEIRMFGGNFAPLDWLFCDGQALPINSNQALFSLLGTTYGGNGQTNFKLPDLRGRVLLHQGARPGGSSYTLGQTGGVEGVVLSLGQMATHHHSPGCSSKPGYLSTPANAVWGVGEQPLYSGLSPNVNLTAAIVGATGGGQAHTNMAPYICVSFIIATVGVFPSQT